MILRGRIPSFELGGERFVWTIDCHDKTRTCFKGSMRSGQNDALTHPHACSRIPGTQFGPFFFANSFFLLGISLVGLVETPQKIAETTRNGLSQGIAVIAAEGIPNHYSNGPPDAFFISWHNFHVRSPVRHGTPCRDYICESFVSAFVPNVSAQILCTRMRGIEFRNARPPLGTTLPLRDYTV
jgi:hypothetical protein